jgi:anthranilate phosphoribosyltransferase
VDSTGAQPGRRASGDPWRASDPNEEVLEAQARVCTGPRQARPLGLRPADPDPGRILQLILTSAQGKADGTPVSAAQMGAFFAAMTLRRTFAPPTNWSAAEEAAFAHFSDQLVVTLPPEIGFLLHPDNDFRPADRITCGLVDPLRAILRGDHLSYLETRQVLDTILGEDISPALAAAVLIGQRMNLESMEESRAYLDAPCGPEAMVPVKLQSLTHLGEPYDGATRYFRPSVFVASVRAALGRPTVLHGVDAMPPKWGVTDEQVVNALGARTDLDTDEAKTLLEDPGVGWVYLSQREYAPRLYQLRQLREHIKKRPPWAATEKVQQLFSCGDNDFMVAGIYHHGYDESLLQLMWERGLRSGLVIKGEEGSSFYSLRRGSTSTRSAMAMNYTRGFRRDGNRRSEFTRDVDPRQYGFEYELSPRPSAVTAAAFAAAGFAALKGVAGHEFDRIALNVGLMDYLLGFSTNPQASIQEARSAMLDGRAATHLLAYVTRAPRHSSSA